MRYRFKFIFRSTNEIDVLTEETPDNFEKRWDTFWRGDDDDNNYLRLDCISTEGQPITVRIHPSDVETFILFSSTIT